MKSPYLSLLIVATVFIFLGIWLFVGYRNRRPEGFDRKISQEGNTWYTTAASLKEGQGCIDFIDSRQQTFHLCGTYRIQLLK